MALSNPLPFYLFYHKVLRSYQARGAVDDGYLFIADQVIAPPR